MTDFIVIKLRLYRSDVPYLIKFPSHCKKDLLNCGIFLTFLGKQGLQQAGEHKKQTQKTFGFPNKTRNSRKKLGAVPQMKQLRKKTDGAGARSITGHYSRQNSLLTLLGKHLDGLNHNLRSIATILGHGAQRRHGLRLAAAGSEAYSCSNGKNESNSFHRKSHIWVFDAH